MSDHSPGSEDAGEPSNVFCACPAIGHEKNERCQDLLKRDSFPGTIIGVTIASSPGQRMAEWSSVIDPMGTTLRFIDITDAGRSAAMSADGFAGQSGAIINVVEMDEVDLHRLGSEIVSQLSEADDEPIVLCLDSLTDLLQFESQSTINRFLNVLTARVEEAGALAHYHIDSAVHEASTLDTLSPLFDETIRPDTGSK